MSAKHTASGVRRDAFRGRVCACCERNDGFEGPAPMGSAFKLVQGELAYACSQKCATALGWPPAAAKGGR
jgi:hypothetical protein